MILLRAHILGFGKLNDVRLDFRRGLNLVFAYNEGGKSTLQRAIIGLLYGQLRADLKVQRRLDSWVDRYKPWKSRDYGGILWCRLADGQEVEIHRSLGREENRVEIRSAGGEDITRRYDHQRNGEVLFAAAHLGMPKGLFESVGVIRENRVSEIDGYETIRDRISNLAQSGKEELSIRRSLAAIEAQRENIGTERAPTKPYRQALDRVQALRAEREAADERRKQFGAWIEERDRCTGDVRRLERELAAVRRALLSARKHELLVKVRSLEEMHRDMQNIDAEIAALEADPDFPAGMLEDLNQFEGERRSLEKHLTEVRNTGKAAARELAQAAAERSELEAYGRFADSTEVETVTEWFVTFLNISLQKDGLQKTILRLTAEDETIEERLGKGTFPSSDWDNDWQTFAREAAEEEQAAAEEGAALAEQAAYGKTALSAADRAARNRRVVAGVLLAPAALLPLAEALNGFGYFPFPANAIIVILFLIASGLLVLSAGKSAAEGRRLKKELADLEAQAMRIREEGWRKRKKLNEAMHASGFEKIDDFLHSMSRREEDFRRCQEIKSRLAETIDARDRLIEQAGEYYVLLKESLASVGLSCSRGNLKFQIDVFRSNMRRFRERDGRYRSCVERSETLALEEKNLAGEYEQKIARIDALLKEAGVETPEHFRRQCAGRQRLLELMSAKESKTREYNRSAGDRPLARWQEELRDLMRQETPPAEEEPCLLSPEDASERSAPFLPYVPAVPEAERQEKECASRLAAAREEYARAAERVRHAFHNVRPSYEIDEDLAAAARDLDEMEMNRAALTTAFDMIEELSRQHQEVLAPQLNAAVEQRFLRLCGGRYEEVKIDPDFQIWVRESDTGALRLAEQLSRGAQDQVYLALRFGILDLVSSPTDPCPCLLDEPFAAYDRIRLREALEVVKEEAERRQLLLFTCKEDLIDPVGRLGANIIRLD
ncbi:MAG TPA: AAA family ATPase [Acidobacteriota bacterium]|nr:AAA family ATPase [Acidobacteriota bacterium]